MKYRVSVLVEGAPPRHFDFDSIEASVGRAADCDVVIDSTADMVSQHHGRVKVRGDQLVFEDTSSNGTFLGDRPIGAISVDKGTLLQLGRTGPHLGFDILERGRPATPKTRVESAPSAAARHVVKSNALVVAPPSAATPSEHAPHPAVLAGAYAAPPPAGALGYGSPVRAMSRGSSRGHHVPAPVYVYAPSYGPSESGEKDAQERDASQLKVLAIFYGILALFAAPTAMFITIFGLAGISHGSAEGAIFFFGLACLAWLGVLVDVFMAFALATHRAHTYCTAVAVLSCLEFPLGTILGVCALLVLTRTTTKRLFAAKVRASDAPSHGWTA
ncbi:MAG: FHA domain-containing protein [Minicystis sp.]